MSEDETPTRLDELRHGIDGIDRALVELLDRRAQTVIAIGEHKRDEGGPIYAPDREAKVLARALGQAETLGSHMPAKTVEAVFREIMSGSFALEQPLRIGYLGPAGSYSHQAAVSHFGQSVSYEDLGAIANVFVETRRGHVDYGLVPIENSTAGSIAETLDAFREHGQELVIYAELVMQIRHALLACGDVGEIREIRSKPEAYAQCQKFINGQLRGHTPSFEFRASASTSAAVIAVREAWDRGERHLAAVASPLAGKLHGVPVLFEGIEDDPNNLTRFVVLARQQAKPTGEDKTSLMFTVGDDAGTLVGVLSCFADAGVNLSHIDKRPSQRENWTYTFFIDALAHRDEARFGTAVSAARAHCKELIVLGSYPRATRAR